jgi:thioredoxin reductase
MMQPIFEDIAVIGAGPYGLSIAAHLAKAGRRLRVFGTPMQTWRTRMPAGMKLKSEGFASTLYDPRNKFRISRYCAERGIPYADIGLPVTLEDFCDYGQEFSRRYVPMLEDRTVVAIERNQTGFDLFMADGQVVQARGVICAAGIADYAHTPPEFSGLPEGVVSHCSDHHDLSGFAGKTIAVVGGGASAADYAALLSQAGATTHLLTRDAKLHFHLPPHARGLRERLRYPQSPLGPGWNSVFYTNLPWAFHSLSEARRVAITRDHLGPAPCWFVRDIVENSVSVHTGTQVTGLTMQGDRARLALGGTTPAVLDVDHIMAATGYKINLAKLSFLDAALRQDIRTDSTGSPKLSSWFESSVPGLYFVGAPAANSFGPLLRFACGAEFASRRLARHWG